jgi:His/Glu/Gln/Arg/opine family amino acid ABC transporter permease subunit
MLSRFISELPEFVGFHNAIFLAKAVVATVALSAIGAVTGCLAGLLLAIARMTTARWLAPLRWAALVLTELFRRIPFLVTLMLVFFAFQLSGFDLPLFIVALLAVFLIASVHRNQWDAAVAMSFSMLAREGMTMLIVSHEMGFIREIASQVAFMAEGKLVESGAPAQIFDAPHEARTREFISKILRH